MAGSWATRRFRLCCLNRLLNKDVRSMIILQLLFMETLPLRAMARFWGAIHQIDLPVPFRAPLYELWTYIFNCNLDVRLHLFYSHGEQESFTHLLLCVCVLVAFAGDGVSSRRV